MAKYIFIISLPLNRLNTKLPVVFFSSNGKLRSSVLLYSSFTDGQMKLRVRLSKFSVTETLDGTNSVEFWKRILLLKMKTCIQQQFSSLISQSVTWY